MRLFSYGKSTFTLLCPEDEKIFAYTRDARQLPANDKTESAELRPYEAVMLYYEDMERK